jgi:hypothetical protein
MTSTANDRTRSTGRPGVPRTAMVMLALATAGFAVNFWAWALLSPLGPKLKQSLHLSPERRGFAVGIFDARRQLHRLVLVEDLRQGRDHHLRDAADRLSVRRSGQTRVRATRLPARRGLLLVYVLADPRESNSRSIPS